MDFVSVLFFLGILVLLSVFIMEIKSMLVKKTIFIILFLMTGVIANFNLSYPSTVIKIEFKKPLTLQEASYNANRIIDFLKVPEKKDRRINPNEHSAYKKASYVTVSKPHYWKKEEKILYIYLSRIHLSSVLSDFKKKFNIRFFTKNSEEIKIDDEKLLRYIAIKLRKLDIEDNLEIDYKKELISELLKNVLIDKERFNKEDMNEKDFEKFLIQKSFLLRFKGEPMSLTYSEERYSPLYTLGEYSSKRY